MSEKKKRVIGIPNGPAGKTKLTEKRLKPARAMKGSLYKDIGDGVRHFWSKRGRDVPDPSHWG